MYDFLGKLGKNYFFVFLFLGVSSRKNVENTQKIIKFQSKNIFLENKSIKSVKVMKSKKKLLKLKNINFKKSYHPVRNYINKTIQEAKSIDFDQLSMDLFGEIRVSDDPIFRPLNP